MDCHVTQRGEKKKKEKKREKTRMQRTEEKEERKKQEEKSHISNPTIGSWNCCQLSKKRCYHKKIIYIYIYIYLFSIILIRAKDMKHK